MSLPEITPIEEPKDLGFGSVVGGANEKRLLNRDGSFNPRRDGLPLLRSLSFYHYFLTITWPKFFAIVVAGYMGANAVFALLYLACGVDSLAGAEPARMGGPFWRAFFFSVETIGTVGYGNVAPNNFPAHVVMTAESLVGLLMFALGTGILFSRFSRPTAALMFSERAVVSPYRGRTAFMFRVTNARSNQLVELEAKVLFSRIEGMHRKYDQVTLERSRVTFFPLSWTVVHPIDETSPLWGMDREAFLAADLELFVLLTATDETFEQTVHARSSYKGEEMEWGARFRDMYTADREHVAIDLSRLHQFDRVDAPASL